MAELSKRLRRADEIIGNLATLDVYGRVAHIMIELAKKDGEEVEEGILIRERPTQQDIASMIGTSRETVSRVLSEFQKRGFVEMRGPRDPALPQVRGRRRADGLRRRWRWRWWRRRRSRRKHHAAS